MKRAIFALVLLWALVIGGTAALADHAGPGYFKLYCSTEQAADQFVDLVEAGLGAEAVEKTMDDPTFKCHHDLRAAGPVDPVRIYREYIGPHTGKEVCMIEAEYRDAAKTKVWAPLYMSLCKEVLHLSDS